MRPWRWRSPPSKSTIGDGVLLQNFPDLIGAGLRHEGEPPRCLVVLDERFSLFPPEETVQQCSVEGIVPGFQSLLTLDTDDVLPPLPFQLSVVAQMHSATWREGLGVPMTVGHLFDDYGDTLARLHLLVTVNGMRLAAAPDPHGLQNGDLAYWRDFYPLDLGPLPPAGGPHPDVGLFIALPARWEAVSQLHGRFVLPAYSGTR